MRVATERTQQSLCPQPLALARSQTMVFSSAGTKRGHLPPWEACKAFAFSTCLNTITQNLGQRACDLLGQQTNEWIAQQLTLQGGGCPTVRAVQKAIKRCQQDDWHPGKSESKHGGRPTSFSAAQKKRMAAAAMALKRKISRPTPAKVRALLPRVCLNPETGEPASNYTIYKIFKTMCFDETEDDPWQYMSTVTKDYLPEWMKPRRVAMAQYILDHMPGAATAGHVAIDPCSCLLPVSATRSEEQRVAALGKSRFMSAESKYKGVNLRASSFSTKQAGRDVLQVHWTPIFVRGRLRIYVCDPDADARDSRKPRKLNDAEDLAKFIEHVLPQELQWMQAQYKWPTLPRTVVHDKASYMVNSKSEKLNAHFAEALRAAGMRSWATDADGSTRWMAGRFSDAYIHETAISHVRRCLDHKFPRASPGETFAQFRTRMAKVEAYLNSADFAAREGGGLMALSKDLRERCRAVVERNGERLSK